MLKTLEDYQKEIARVQEALQRTKSEYLKRDYEKYLKRLQREMRKHKTQRSKANENRSH